VADLLRFVNWPEVAVAEMILLASAVLLICVDSRVEHGRKKADAIRVMRVLGWVVGGVAIIPALAIILVVVAASIFLVIAVSCIVFVAVLGALLVASMAE
jgi:hypothetical protein